MGMRVQTMKWLIFPALLTILWSTPLMGREIPSGSLIQEVLTLIEREHVEAGRVSPTVLLRGALNRVVAHFPSADFLLQTDASQINLEFRVGTAFFRHESKVPEQITELIPLLRRLHDHLTEHLNASEQGKSVLVALLDGLLGQLGPYSRLLEPAEHSRFLEVVSGRFAGPGLILETDGHYPVVLGTFEGSPAQRAGIRPGTKIIRVENFLTAGMGLSEVEGLLQGNPGSRVAIRLDRRARAGRESLILRREKLHPPSVVEHRFQVNSESWIGYLRISEFNQTTSREFSEALSRLFPHGHGLLGLILDLRGNPGGILEEAIRVADRLLDRGEIVTLIGRGGENQVIRARGYDSLTGPPMIILQDERSASGAELVAAALAHNRRALVLGTPSVGKGTVQSMIPLSSGYALKMTRSAFLAPGGHTIRNKGVQPDIRLEPARVAKRGQPVRLHLEGSHEPPGGVSTAGRTPLTRLQYLEKEVSLHTGVPLPVSPGKREKILERDFPVTLARKILVFNRKGEYQRLVINSLELVRAEGFRQQQAIHEALSDKGVDWREGDDPGEGRAEIIRVSLSHRTSKRENWITPKKGVRGGDQIRVEIAVRNTGKSAGHRLLLRTERPDGLFGQAEWPFGRMDSGAVRTWHQDFILPDSLPGGSEQVHLQLINGTGRIMHRAVLNILVNEVRPPLLQAELRFREDGSWGSSGDGNGRLSAGERLGVEVRLKNLPPKDEERYQVFLQVREKETALEGTAWRGFPLVGRGKHARFAVPLPRNYRRLNLPLFLQVFDERNARIVLEKPFSIPIKKPIRTIVLTPPRLSVKSSREGHSPRIQLTGKLSDDTMARIVRVRLNGFPLIRQISEQNRRSLEFSLYANLREGRNILTVEGFDDEGMTDRKDLVFWHDSRIDLAEFGLFRASW